MFTDISPVTLTPNIWCHEQTKLYIKLVLNNFISAIDLSCMFYYLCIKPSYMKRNGRESFKNTATSSVHGVTENLESCRAVLQSYRHDDRSCTILLGRILFMNKTLLCKIWTIRYLSNECSIFEKFPYKNMIVICW